ncbi:hypothetical protein F511_25899 [Dorcoceras hygrometricum]|uniref:Uncharacterized protein n=1 Tax=Dorcoceras hygrometricum TaxID=472368 RepID=A0A2Z7ASK6_9LAMI|nr:hypothetical protein F511_25899 [Dorcoceras hygrometricum]
MGSNPSTERNYKTAVNSKNKMQMLCMRKGTTAEGYNQGREPKNSMHSSTESAIDMCGHGECRTCGSYPLSPTRPPIPDASTAQRVGIGAMSVFDLQDACMAIEYLATLDLPMFVNLIGIYGLKGPYCTLTMTDWFLQALSVIPRGSWGDVARRFTMIRWASPKMWFWSHTCCGPTASCIPEPLRVTQVLVSRFPHGNSAQFVERRRRKDGSATSQN